MTRNLEASLAAVLLAGGAVGCGDADVPPAQGLPPPTTLASGQKGPRAIAVDEDGIYWTNAGDGTISMLRRGETTPRVIADGQGRALGIAVDVDSVFWTSFGTEGASDGAVRKTSKLSKGAIIDIMTGQPGPIGIALDDSCVFWTTGGTKKADGVVMSMWKEAVLPAPVASTEGGPVDVAVDPSGVFWLDRGIGDEGEGAALKYVKYVGDPAIVLTTDVGDPSRLALDAEHVFWEDSGAVQEISKDGGKSSAIATGEEGFSGLAIDASGVYWGSSGDGELKRAPKGGGAASILAVSQHGVTDVAVDAHGVYWVNEELGAVMMLSK